MGASSIRLLVVDGVPPDACAKFAPIAFGIGSDVPETATRVLEKTPTSE